jgi:hypothetical protein
MEEMAIAPHPTINARLTQYPAFIKGLETFDFIIPLLLASIPRITPGPTKTNVNATIESSKRLKRLGKNIGTATAGKDSIR